ncbi:hypothetical protein FHR70_003933 [Microvirga lupini]|uniref:Apea-like HEPN domain-containing protein n=1 Tax=Microvirga lupini TaxID=420324 RepID=A0A7W4VP96_9HYPH|nr:hypothetical protein [Microvirga lupini]MBB3020845.1 hypothetical protein [Microvirga lupini]
MRLAKALDKAKSAKIELSERIASSLELFLLGHSETPELSWDTCIMLSAMAFERLLEPKREQGEGTAHALARTFATVWEPFTGQTISDTKGRIKPDNDPKFAGAQQNWPLHRKWMKELYEARSSMAHRGNRPKFSQNWKDWQHLVIAAFVYPFTVKLMLAKEGLYQLGDRELGACEALDKLLGERSTWGRGWRQPPEWPTILSLSEADRVIQTWVEKAYEETMQPRYPKGGVARPSRNKHAQYD